MPSCSRALHTSAAAAMSIGEFQCQNKCAYTLHTIDLYILLSLGIKSTQSECESEHHMQRLTSQKHKRQITTLFVGVENFVSWPLNFVERHKSY